MPLIVLIIIITVGIYGFANYYIGLRGYQYIGSYIPLLNSKIYWVIFWIIALSFIVGRFNMKFMPAFVKNAFNIVGSYWMSVMLYSILLLPVIDLLLFLIKRFYPASRELLQLPHFNLYLGMGMLVVIAGILALGTYHGINVKIKAYDISIPKSASSLEGLHTVFLSDLHLGNIVDNSRLRQLVEKVNGLKPDIVLLGGDIIDDSIEPYLKQNMAETFRKLNSKYGTYAVLGNHDGYGSKVADVVKAFEDGGIRVLRDEYVKIEDGFYLAGRLDSSMQRSGEKRKALDQLLTGVDKSLPVILMDHNPAKLGEAEKENVDLQLSGHTHGGQLFPAGLITNMIYEVDWGYLKKDDFQVIVSSGAATWGPPIRLGSDSEILDINISFTKKGS